MHRTPLIVVNSRTPLAAELFSRIGEVIPLESSAFTPDTVRNADIIIVRSETRVDANLLEGSRVRFVGTVTIGTDHIDLNYLKSKGIPLASAPGSNANSVKEYVAAALLTWSERTGNPLKGKTIGIVGVGSVGSKIAELARVFGMTHLLNDPPRARAEDRTSFLSLDDLMDADIVTLHVPLTQRGEDRTFHLFDKNRIGRMKRGSVLINTARGGVVSSEALKQALRSSHISAAILDVWEKEPAVDPELLHLVMLGTPHIAGYSLDGKLNAVKMVYESVCEFLKIPAQWPKDLGKREGPERITVPRNITGVQEVVIAAVRKAYSIEEDDSALRALAEFPPDVRGTYFSRLRSEYRIRKEFGHFEVDLSPKQVAAGTILRKLGFRTRQ